MPRSLSSLGGSFANAGEFKAFIEPAFLVDKPFNITSAEVVTVNFDGEDKEVIHFHITLLPYTPTDDNPTPVKPGQYILTLGVNPARMEVVDYFTGPDGKPVSGTEPVGPITLVRGKKRVKGNFPFIFAEYNYSDVG